MIGTRPVDIGFVMRQYCALVHLVPSASDMTSLVSAHTLGSGADIDLIANVQIVRNQLVISIWRTPFHAPNCLISKIAGVLRI